MSEPASRAAQVGDAPTNPWPASAVFGSSGLEVGGVYATELAERFGTPLLVFDEDELRRRMHEARECFPRVLYAVKAFTAGPVIRMALEEGLDLLAASGGEVEACLRAGARGDRIALHGNAKSDDELRLAVEEGLALVIADQAEELERLDAIAAEAGREQAALLRVVPEVQAATHEAIATGHEDSQFGTAPEEVADALRRASALDHVRLEGLHAHVGSQVLDPDAWLLEVDALVRHLVRAREAIGWMARLLDVGGGFGIAYTGERAIGLPEIAALVRARIQLACGDAGLPVPTVLAEPGRSLVGPPGLTLYRVAGRKSAGARRLVAVDGGMSDNPRPSLYDARYAVAAASPAHDAGAHDAWTVVGRHCESGDVVAEDVSLPASLARGDLLAVAATGAYTYSLASTYNRIGRPAVVAVSGGVVREWLRREDAADLGRLEVSPPRAPASVPAPADIEIRPARPGDARAFVAFWRAVVAEGRFVRTQRVTRPLRSYRRRFRRSWTDRHAHVLALEGKAVVGELSIQREEHPVTRHVASLGIAVAASHRGRGIGAVLLSEAFRWARAVGVDKIVLSVYPYNARAIALYRRYGFVDEGRLRHHSRRSSGDVDEILMAAWVPRGEA